MKGPNLIILLVSAAILAAFGVYLALGTPGEEPLDIGGGDDLSRTETPKVPTTKKGSAANPEQITPTAFDPNKAEGGFARVGDGDSGLALFGRVLDPSRRQVSGAMVRLVVDLSGQRGRPVPGKRIAEASAPNGHFRIEGLEWGRRYILEVEHPDFCLARISPIDTSLPASLEQNVVLRPGVAVSGRVTDVLGKPIAGAEVKAYDTSVLNQDPERQLERVAKTDASGRYQLPPLRTGIKRVIARHADHSSDGISRLSLREGEPITNLDFELGAGLILTGIVRDSKTGEPVAGAGVHARAVRCLGDPVPQPPVHLDEESTGDEGNRGDENAELRRPQPLAPGRGGNTPVARTSNGRRHGGYEISTRANEKGIFVLKGAAEAEYVLRVEAAGYLQSNGQRVQPNQGPVTIELRATARIHGRVVDGRSGEPVPNFILVATTNPKLKLEMGRNRQVFSDEEGRFVYACDRPGQLFLLAHADGFCPTASEALNVAIGERREGIEIKLSRGGSMRGRCLDPEGKPLVGARIELGVPLDPAQGGAGLFGRMLQLQNVSGRWVTTGSKGLWEMTGLRPGSYQAVALHERYGSTRSETVDIKDEEEVAVADLRLPKAAVVQGIVRTKEGKPDFAAQLSITSANPRKPFSKTVETDSEGRFVFNGLAEGEYRVLLLKRSGVNDLGEVFKSAMDPTNIIRLREGQVVNLEF